MTLRRLSLPLFLAATCLALIAFALPAHADDLQDANKLLKQGQYAQALEKADKYLAGKPKDAQGRFLKGLILTEMHRDKEAIAVFTQLTEDHPELPEPYNNLAVIYAQQKQYDKARQALEMAIRTNPSYATARENLGDIYARMASQAYDKALQIDSSNTSAQTKLALIRELMGSSAHPVAGTTPARTPGMAVAVAPPPAKAVEEKPATTKPAAAAPAPTPTPRPAPAATAAAKPVAAPTAKPADVTAAVDKTVEAWAAAWSRKNVKAYLGFYARDFQTPGGESRAAWEAGRAKHIGKPGKIQVSIENLRVSADGSGRVTAKFRQHYRSASFKSNSNKVLVLVKHDGRWLIHSEQVGK